MFDELEWLREGPDLRRLLGHYAEAGAADRDAWQDRLTELEGVEARELVRLHGLLIAFGWAEQNTGHTPAGRPGSVPACYRATAAGTRALRLYLSEQPECDSEPVPAAGGAAGDAQGEGEIPAPNCRGRQKATLTRRAPTDTEDVSVPVEARGELAAAVVGQRAQETLTG